MTIFFRTHEDTAKQSPKIYDYPQPVTRPVRVSLLYHGGGKRLLDLTLICLAAPLIVFLVAILAVLVASKGGQPFYTQSRVGQNGRIYKMWKLRSMVPNADQKLAGYLAHNSAAQEEWDKTQKLKDDPRITAFGRLLRRTSMDELPQLWNVVRGEMSLVGPRPMMPSQMNLYPGEEYYNLRPGITGLWQVSARNNCSFADRAHYDAHYDKIMSLKVDCRILAATVQVVLRATGH